MISDAFSNGLFELRRFEQGVLVWDAGNGLVRLEHPLRHSHVDIHAGLEVKAQSAQHDGNKTTCSRADNEVEIIAWFRGRLSAWRFAFRFDVDSVHELL